MRETAVKLNIEPATARDPGMCRAVALVMFAEREGTFAVGPTTVVSRAP
jgi:hypothetical protein